MLQDFNSHSAWHPAVGESRIERNEPSDQVGCVRNFFLKDGNHIREQLLALSDRDYISTYCILDATLPMRNYVATVQLKRVTDGDRTFWHWESTSTCRKAVSGSSSSSLAAECTRRGSMRSPSTSGTARAAFVSSLFFDGRRAARRRRDRLRRPEVLQFRRLNSPEGEVLIRQIAVGVHRRLHPQRPVPHDRAARADRMEGGGRSSREPLDPLRAGRSGGVCVHAARCLRHDASAGRRSARPASRLRRR